MNDKFSFQRLGLLIRTVFIQNWKKDLRIFLCVMGVLAVLHAFNGFYFPINFPIVAVLLYIAGSTFKRLGNQPSAISYMMMPASTLEKTITAIFYVNIYYVVLMVAAGLLGFGLAILLNPALHTIGIPEMCPAKIITVDLGTIIMGLTAGISVLLFGSVYFKKFAILKTGLVALALFVVLTLALSAIMNFHTCSYHYFDDITTKTLKILYYVILSVATLFFWFMTWLRLRETEA